MRDQGPNTGRASEHRPGGWQISSGSCRARLLGGLFLLLSAAGVWALVLPNANAGADSPRPAIPLGAAINYERLQQDPLEMRTYSDNFNAFTPENVMKMESLQPREGVFDFGKADAMVAWGASRGLRMRAHNLVWHNQMPEWARRDSQLRSRDEMIEIMTTHIRTVMTHYRGKFAEWDILNEAVGEDGSLGTASPWYERIGPEYVEIAFRAARAADPSAKLFYNDDNIGLPGRHQDGVYNLVRTLKAKGLIDGVGFQSHISNTYYLDTPAMVTSLNRFASLGLQVAITEADVRIHVDARPMSYADSLELQRDRYVRLAAACHEVAACTSFTVWGVSDRDSWFGADQAPLLFDTSFAKKPAYDALVRTLEQGLPAPVAVKSATRPPVRARYRCKRGSRRARRSVCRVRVLSTRRGGPAAPDPSEYDIDPNQLRVQRSSPRTLLNTVTLTGDRLAVAGDMKLGVALASGRRARARVSGDQITFGAGSYRIKTCVTVRRGKARTLGRCASRQVRVARGKAESVAPAAATLSVTRPRGARKHLVAGGVAVYVKHGGRYELAARSSKSPKEAGMWVPKARFGP